MTGKPHLTKWFDRGHFDEDSTTGVDSDPLPLLRPKAGGDWGRESADWEEARRRRKEALQGRDKRVVGGGADFDFADSLDLGQGQVRDLLVTTSPELNPGPVTTSTSPLPCDDENSVAEVFGLLRPTKKIKISKHSQTCHNFTPNQPILSLIPLLQPVPQDDEDDDDFCKSLPMAEQLRGGLPPLFLCLLFLVLIGHLAPAAKSSSQVSAGPRLVVVRSSVKSFDAEAEAEEQLQV